MSKTVYRFGDFVLNVGIRELRRGGVAIDLPPKVFDCVAYLVEHHDRAVGQDELIAAVWGRTELAAGAVRKTILRARRALGDDGETPRMLGTVPRFGYRWVCEVQVEEPVAGPIEAAALPDAARVPREGRRIARLWPLLAATAVMIAVVAVVASRRATSPATPSTEAAAQAGQQAAGADIEANLAIVLPVDAATVPQETWLRFGLMDLIGNRLRGAGVAVMPSSSVVSLVGMPGAGTPDASSPAMRARWLLFPRATRSGDVWTVSIRLQGSSGDSSTATARDASVVRAARTAVDELTAWFGVDEKRIAAAEQPAAIEEWLQRAEARVLVHDLDGARKVLRAAPAELAGVPEVRLRLARIELDAGNYPEADRAFRELKASLPADADPVLRARIEYGIGKTCAETMRLDEALQAYTAALQLLDGRGIPADLGIALNSRGSIRARLRQFDLASDDFSRAAVSSTLAGDALSVARAEVNQAIMDSSRGLIANALPAYEHAAKVFERFGALNELSIVFDGMMTINLELLQPADALAAAERGRQALQRLENPRNRRIVDFRRGAALWANGRLRDAATLLAAVERDAERENDRWVLPLAHATMVGLDVDAGRLQKALLGARAAVAELASPEFVDDRATTWVRLVQLMLQFDEPGAQEVEKVRRWADEVDVPVAKMAAHLAKAELDWRSGHRTSARESFDAALSSADRTGLPIYIAFVASRYAEALIEDGDLAGATAVVGRISRWASRDFRCGLVRLRLYHALGQQDAWQSALDELAAVAGERTIPDDLRVPPTPPVEVAGPIGAGLSTR